MTGRCDERSRSGTGLRRAVVIAVALTTLLELGAPAALAADGPPGFYYGSDGSGPGPVGSEVEYTMPTCGGAFGAYIGRITYASDPTYNNPTYSNDSNANAAASYGLGSSNYFDLAGPTEDPGYNGSAAEATAFGQSQGFTAQANWQSFYSSHLIPRHPIVFADLEYANPGWTGNQALNRDVYNGFWGVIAKDRVDIGRLGPFTLYAGVYTNSGWWDTYISGSLAGSFELTSQVSFSSIGSNDCAYEFASPKGDTYHIADFYAGYSQQSPCAVGWQWVAGNLDYDQLDAAKIEAGMGSGGVCN